MTPRDSMPPSRPALILASSSPQRERLLREAGYRFRVVPPDPAAECGVCSRETPGELTARLARQKAVDVVEGLKASGKWQPGEVVLACDTVCECLGQVLGKPENREHAGTMLRRLSGRTHHVYSGLCLWPLPDGPRSIELAITTLQMDALADEAIEEYLASGQWEGKAGAFGYQDRAGWLHLVEGSESNVIGLPLELLGQMLARITVAARPSTEGG